MTIASQTSRVSYTGDGVNTAFSVPFYFQFNIDIRVYVTNTLGIATLQVMGTDYSLAGATLSAGGTCTFVTAPPLGYSVVIYRDPLLTQTTSYNNNDPFPAKSHELALDKALTIDQRTRDIAVRALRFPDSDAPTLSATVPTALVRANKALAFDALGQVTVINPTGAPGPVGASQIFDTRAQAIGTVISPALSSIIINSYNATFPIAPAVYVLGTSTGPLAFLDAGGRWWQLSLTNGPANVLWFGVAGDGRVEHTAISAAITVMNAQGGGRLYFPRPSLYYHVQAPIQGKLNVSLVGDFGLNSKIYCDACTGLEFNVYTGVGQIVVEGLYFEGHNAPSTATVYAISVPGTENELDEIYGLTIRNCMFRTFYCFMHFRAVRNLTIEDCFGLDVQSAIELTGACYVVSIINNRFARAAGSGVAGNLVGVDMTFHTFTVTGSILKCEGIDIHFNQFFGFAYDIRADLAASVNVTDNGFDASFYGVWLSAVSGFCNIENNDIEMQSASAAAGVFLSDQSVETNLKINIKGNHIIGSANTANVSGIIVRNLQNHHSIEDNSIEGMKTNDIDLVSPGKLKIHNNMCKSTAVTNAIRVGTRQSGVITVTENTCIKPITVLSASDLANGYVIQRHNVINGVLEAPYVFTNVGTPQGVVTSGYIGQDCFNTATGIWFRANAAGVNNQWVALN